MTESSKPSGDHSSIVGVTPRLRSLRISEVRQIYVNSSAKHHSKVLQDPETSPEASLTPRHLTPTAAGSYSESERSPFRHRHVGNGWQFSQQLASKRSVFGGSWKLVFIGLGTLCLVVAAFYAGAAFGGGGSQPSRVSREQQLSTSDSFSVQSTVTIPVSRAVSEGQKPVSEAVPSKDVRKILPSKQAKTAAIDVAREVAKAVAYVSDKETAALNQPKLTSQHPKIYIAELPPKYNLVLLEAYLSLGGDAASSENTRKIAIELANAIVANPFGDPVGEESEGLRATNPSSLDVMFYTQLRSSPLRTKNLTEADLVLVPFWVHKLVKLDQELEKPNRHDLAAIDFWKDVPRSLPMLGTKPHFIVVPGREADLRGTCGGHGLDFLCHPLAEKFTVLTPEILTGKPSSLASNRVAPGLIGSLRESSDSIAVPDIGSLHFPQESQLLTGSFDAAATAASKAKLIFEAFRARAPLRKALKSQCSLQPQQCQHSEPPTFFQHHSETDFAKTVRDNNRGAWFCLQPPGDAAVRSSLYDCLVGGAIPVVFDNKVPKILPFAHAVTWEAFLVNVHPDDILKNKKDVVKLLESKYSVDERLARLAMLHSIRHLFQYSLQPAHHLVRFDQLATVTKRDDAFTMSMKSLLRHICRSGQLQDRCS